MSRKTENAEKVKKYLEKKDIDVVMTREDDVMEDTKLEDMKKQWADSKASEKLVVTENEIEEIVSSYVK